MSDPGFSIVHEFYIRFAGEDKRGILKKGQEFVVYLDIRYTVNQLKDLIVEQHGLLLGVTSRDEFYLKCNDIPMCPEHQKLSTFGVSGGVSVDFYKVAA